jgi:hypothetical protein
MFYLMAEDKPKVIDKETNRGQSVRFVTNRYGARVNVSRDLRYRLRSAVEKYQRKGRVWHCFKCEVEALMRLLQPGVQQIGIWAVLSLGIPFENDANVNTIWFRVS